MASAGSSYPSQMNKGVRELHPEQAIGLRRCGPEAERSFGMLYHNSE